MSRGIERLTEAHCFDFFDCGEPELDSWPQKHALEDQELGRSATHVWTDDGGEYVVGYFTLLPTITRAEDGGIFSIIKPNRYQAQEVPGVLIGKLALDRSLRGSGEGMNLLADALTIAVDAMMLIGGRHVLVDPMKDRDKLRAWYIGVGFREIEGSDRLYIDFRE
ncbi:N-acetyltransferase [Gordonia sp. PP30]|uniref:N-acetyltransferase n=1 Tax=Gordonia sp. PP30 TaxID=2935861 RepID=UPI001FFF4901|nr:N-acetyltransferase [Gordonia sp. PP30]UQE74241.1 N-acetyltransferase [Gordonia sp. PP30]